MIDKYKRQNDMLRAIESLDITPSMYKNADEKYHALADYLSRHTDVTLDMPSIRNSSRGILFPFSSRVGLFVNSSCFNVR